MKRLFSTLAFITGLTPIFAQSSHNGYRDGWPASSTSEPAAEIDYESTEMVLEANRIRFTDLPAMRKATWAIITNAEGEYIKEKRVFTSEDVIDVSRLKNGLYFVTLVYRNKSKKGFVLHIE